MHDLSLFSSVASCSSGVELDRAQIVVVGNARGHGGNYKVGHSVMKDALDQDGIWEAIRNAGIELPDRPHHTDLGDRLVNVFLKCEASPDGKVRGRRNAMLDDSDVSWHRQIKATVGGVTASVTGDPAVFVSVAAVHQGPSGGGPVAAIVKAYRTTLPAGKWRAGRSAASPQWVKGSSLRRSDAPGPRGRRARAPPWAWAR